MTVWHHPPQAWIPGVQNRVFFSEVLHDWVGLNVLVPPGGDGHERFPVIYWFHGEGGNENTGRFLAPFALDAMDQENAPPFLMVFVNLGAGLDDGVGRYLTDELVPFVDAHYPTLARRTGRAIEGVGTGATAAVELVLARPDLFCSASAFAAAPGPEALSFTTEGPPPQIRLVVPDRNPATAEFHGQVVRALKGRGLVPTVLELEGLHDDITDYYDAMGHGVFRFHFEALDHTPFAPALIPQSNGSTVHRNLRFSGTERRPLLLDLTLPKGPGPFPLVLFFFGGAFRVGAKKANMAARLVEDGYATASAQYRLTGEAPFPAQLVDAKAAVRWLRAHAAKYRIDANRIGVWGMSAGAWVATMLGVTGETREFDEGDDLEHPSRVRAVCDFYGPTDLLQMDSWPGAFSHDAPQSAESRLVGGPLQKYPDRARRANPLTYVSPAAAPVLIAHDRRDLYVPYHQSELLATALTDAGVPVELIEVEEADYPYHGFDDSGDRRRHLHSAVDAFFARHLK